MAFYTFCALELSHQLDPAIAEHAVFIIPRVPTHDLHYVSINRHQLSSSYSRLDFAIFTHINYKHVSIIRALIMTPGTSAIFRVSVKRHAKLS